MQGFHERFRIGDCAVPGVKNLDPPHAEKLGQSGFEHVAIADRAVLRDFEDLAVGETQLGGRRRNVDDGCIRASGQTAEDVQSVCGFAAFLGASGEYDPARRVVAFCCGAGGRDAGNQQKRQTKDHARVRYKPHHAASMEGQAPDGAGPGVPGRSSGHAHPRHR